MLILWWFFNILHLTFYSLKNRFVRHLSFLVGMQFTCSSSLSSTIGFHYMWPIRFYYQRASLIVISFPSFPGVRVLVDAREKLHIPWGDPENQKHGDSLMAFNTRSAKMANGQLETSVFLQYLSAIKALWEDSGIQNAYDRRREFQLVGGCPHSH